MPWQHASDEKWVPLSLSVIKVAKFLQPLLHLYPTAHVSKGKKKVLRHSVSCCPSCALTSGLFRIIYSSVSHISCRWFGAEFPNLLSNSSLLEISETSAQVQTRKRILKAKPILEEFLLSQLHTASNISAQLINAVKPAVFHITIEQEHNWSFLLEVRHIQSPIY